MPGQTITVSGANYATGVQVTVSATFALQSGGYRTITATAQTGERGTFTASLSLPGNAAPDKVTLTAKASNGQASTQIEVQAAPTPTPSPATPTPTPQPHSKHGLHIDWISVWYHNVRAGTYDHVVIQGYPHTTLGIWVTVIFPSGKHYYYFQNTDSHGQWQETFGVPRDAISRYSNQAHVTFQLWHGKSTYRSFSSFTVV